MHTHPRHGVVKEFKTGDPDANLHKDDHYVKGNPTQPCFAVLVLSLMNKFAGRVYMASQQHFYLEPQAAYAVPDEDGQLFLSLINRLMLNALNRDNDRVLRESVA
jgi:xanthine dehydrogenase molybdopterin-binding subunit B